jgi:hypothetical protein
MHIKQLLITVSRVFSCVQLSYIDPILLSHSYICHFEAAFGAFVRTLEIAGLSKVDR